MEDNKNSKITNVTIIALIIGLALGFALGASWQKGRIAPDTDTNGEMTETENGNDVSTTTTGTNGTDATGNGMADTNRITVTDQKAGKQVVVGRVVANEETWVAVREDRGGELGNILGARKVGQGTHSDVTVNLLRGTEANGTYYVVLYRDNGDGAFSNTIDTLITANGRTVTATFKAL